MRSSIIHYFLQQQQREIRCQNTELFRIFSVYFVIVISVFDSGYPSILSRIRDFTIYISCYNKNRHLHTHTSFSARHPSMRRLWTIKWRCEKALLEEKKRGYPLLAFFQTMRNVSNTMSREGAKSKQLGRQRRVGGSPPNTITGVAINQVHPKKNQV